MQVFPVEISNNPEYFSELVLFGNLLAAQAFKNLHS